jgi:hypothetical protein
MRAHQWPWRIPLGGRTLVCVVVVGWWLTASSVSAQPEAAVGVDRLNEQIMSVLVGVWSQLVQGVMEDPGFLDTAKAEELLARQEALMAIRWGMMETLRGPREEGGGPGGVGAYEFVSWFEMDRTYWVVDTRNGRLQFREAQEIPMEEAEEEDEGG